MIKIDNKFFFKIEQLRDYGLSNTIILKHKDLNLIHTFFNFKNIKLFSSTKNKIILAIKKAAFFLKDFKLLVFIKEYLDLNTFETFNLNIDKKILIDDIYLKFNNKLMQNVCNYIFEELVLNNFLTKLNENEYIINQPYKFNSTDELINYLKHNLSDNEFETLYNYYFEKTNFLQKNKLEIKKCRAILRRIKNLNLLDDFFKIIQEININEINYDFSFLQKSNLFLKYKISYDLFKCLFGENEKDFNCFCLIQNFYKNRFKKHLLLNEEEILKLNYNKEIKNKLFLVLKKFSCEEKQNIYSKNALNLIKSVFKINEVLSIDEINERIYIKFNKKLSVRRIINLCDNENPFVSLGHYKYKFLNEKLINDNLINEIKNVFKKNKGVFYLSFFINGELKNICKKLCIENENEFHNFCKKNIKNDEWIKFKRMPTINLGYKNKKDFYVDLLKQFSSIHISEFVNYICVNYGGNKKSLMSNLPLTLKKYFNNTILQLNINLLEEKNKIKLLENFFKNSNVILKKDVKNFFIENQIDLKYFNSQTFNYFNFSVEKKLLIKKDFSIKKLILQTIKQKGFFQINKDLKEFHINSILYSLKSLIDQSLIIKINKFLFRDFNEFKNSYFNENIILNFKNKLLLFLEKNNFVSLDKIIQIFSNEFQFLKEIESNIIYYLISSFKKIYVTSRKYKIFSNNKETLASFFNLILKQKQQIKLNELKKCLIEDFLISINEKDLIYYVLYKTNLKFDKEKNLISI